MKYNLAQNEPLEINGDVYIKGVGTYDGTNAGGSDVKTLKYALDNNNLTEITWRDLVDLRNRGGLIPGMQYRITDYTCTTTQKNGTKSAGHVFDVIVTADSKNKLNEDARAINHKFDNPNDDYFKDCDLNAWKIWYCLDNDTTRFDWVDNSNDANGNPVGRGVIYRMIDEFNNDCPYDFKNIQFYRKWDADKSLWSTIPSDNTGVPCYTFSSSGNSATTFFTDTSLLAPNSIYSNVIGKYVTDNKQTLNNICFFGNICYNNTFGNNCNSNTFGNDCYYNTFGNICYNNTFGNNFQENTFGKICYNNTFGNYFQGNTFGNDCNNNTFGNRCYSNTFGNYCNNNTFGNHCNYNTFGNYCNNNTFGNYIQESQFGDGVQYFGITTGSMTTKPTSANTKSYIRWLIVENGVRYVNAYVTGTTSDTSYCQNVRICQGCSGTSNSYKSFEINNVNKLSQLIVCYNSSGTLKTGNLGNLFK